MNPAFTATLLLFALTACAFIALGLYGLLRRRPVGFSARWLFGLLVLCFAPNLMLWLGTVAGPEGATIGPVEWALLVIYVVLFAYLWRRLGGYFVFGVSGAALRAHLEPLIADLGSAGPGRAGEETAERSAGELQLTATDWAGVAQMQLRGARGHEQLPRLVAGLKAELRSGALEFQYGAGVFYLAFGLLFLAVTVIVGVQLAPFV